jgi:hypothetical protein
VCDIVSLYASSAAQDPYKSAFWQDLLAQPKRALCSLSVKFLPQCDKPTRPRLCSRLITELTQGIFRLFFNELISNTALFGGWSMGGIVIAFPGVRASTRRIARKMSLPRSPRQRPPLTVQIERITALLEELEDISAHASNLPPVMLARARDGICNAEQVLGLRQVPDAVPPILEQEGDPQPHVDREVLERHFNSRNQYQ